MDARLKMSGMTSVAGCPITHVGNDRDGDGLPIHIMLIPSASAGSQGQLSSPIVRPMSGSWNLSFSPLVLIASNLAAFLSP
ncbi:MAG: hypothetical protein E4H32_05210 [Nitrospirales bacterium]|nr:MAG: hypothetical protein E4H32_05210 [Nitrospirales bacterium]